MSQGGQSPAASRWSHFVEESEKITGGAGKNSAKAIAFSWRPPGHGEENAAVRFLAAAALGIIAVRAGEDYLIGVALNDATTT